jgi:hypothetical protein
MNVRLVDEVYGDLRTARDWYDGKSASLGDDFVDLFFSTVRTLPNVSLHHAIDETGYRPIRMRRFTAVIYYDLSDSEIVIVGLLAGLAIGLGLGPRLRDFLISNGWPNESIMYIAMSLVLVSTMLNGFLYQGWKKDDYRKSVPNPTAKSEVDH